MRIRTKIIFGLVVTSIYGCGEPFREEGHIYGNAARKAIEAYRVISGKAQASEGPFWNDCGREVTCLFLYNTQDQGLVKAIVVSLLAAQAEINKPGIKLTVYSSSHNETKVVFREVTIK